MDFLLKEICFVEKDNDGGALEKLVADDGLKECFTLFHTIL